MNRERDVTRPRIVVVAAGMLAGGGALIVGEAWRATERLLLGLGFQEQMQGWQGSEFGLVRAVGAASAGFAAVDLAGAAIGAAAGCCLILAGLFTVFGHNWARAAGWVVGFPVLLWCGVLLVFYAVAGVPPEDPAEAWPYWLDHLDIVLLSGGAVLLIAALVCQTVPRADTYFRTRRQAPADDGTITEMLTNCGRPQ